MLKLLTMRGLHETHPLLTTSGARNANVVFNLSQMKRPGVCGRAWLACPAPKVPFNHTIENPRARNRGLDWQHCHGPAHIDRSASVHLRDAVVCSRDHVLLPDTLETRGVDTMRRRVRVLAYMRSLHAV